MFSNKDIARYYDVSEVHYRRVWNLDKHFSLHYGYWDESTKNLHQALLNINKILARKASILDSDLVLDAGCGIGGSATWLAYNIRCAVTGISLSAKQVSRATLLAAKDGLSNKIIFEEKDFTATGYPDASFDVIWAIESVCHTNDKKQFMDEAYRLLRKGGRLVMADFFKKDGLVGKEAQWISQFASGWAVNDFATIEKFELELLDSGFDRIQIENITKAIRPSARRLYRAWFPGALLGLLYRIFHPKATDFGKNNVDTAYLQYKCLKKNLWQYFTVLAYKKE